MAIKQRLENVPSGNLAVLETAGFLVGVFVLYSLVLVRYILAYMLLLLL